MDGTGIDRSIRHCDKAKKKVKPIVVTLTSFNVTGSAFWSKRTKKPSPKILQQKSCQKRIGNLNDVREKYGFNNVWSYEDNILYEANNEEKVYYE